MILKFVECVSIWNEPILLFMFASAEELLYYVQRCFCFREKMAMIDQIVSRVVRSLSGLFFAPTKTSEGSFLLRQSYLIGGVAPFQAAVFVAS